MGVVHYHQVANPLPGVDQALVIAGSDKRGTIYGIYDLSEQIGVSPVVLVGRCSRRNITMRSSSRRADYAQGPPAVKYRGIFINDEEPAFRSWAREKFGGLNSKDVRAHVRIVPAAERQLLWPAMWGNAFNEDDPLNPKLADEYGIVMGTSHHEPMIRAQQEWTKSVNYGNGSGTMRRMPKG